MSVAVNANLLARLPLPLAQLYRRAHNAQTAPERHLSAFYLWEAALKLLGCTAVAVYAARPKHDPSLVERLQNLARPALGHWWEFVRLLVPALADGGDPGFRAVRDLLLGRSRDDLPRVAGLDAALLEVLEGKTAARTTVRLTELFDRLVRYRNSEIGHGAVGQRPPAFHERMGRALLAGVPELLERLDVLAGRRLVYVADVRLLSSGRWLAERFELTGDAAGRITSLDLPDTEEARRLRPLPERVYLDGGDPAPAAADGPAGLVGLHPLLWYDPEADETLFLNARRGKSRVELLSYSTGRTVDRADLAGAQQELLSRLLDLPVSGTDLAAWAEKSRAEEPARDGEAPAGPTAAPRRLGEFELLSELGRGGMGVVYRAWQPSLGRQVALKALFRSGDPKADARFAREIRALGKVEHPHLVKIYTSGSDGDRWFYAMELIEGAALDQVCARLGARSSRPDTVDAATWLETVRTACAEAHRLEKPLSDSGSATAPPAVPSEPAAPPVAAVGRGYARQVAELVKQAAEAAHALHEHGIVHRDVKPGNILLSAEGRPVLLDLGLAQLADEVEGRLTRTRQFVGTLRYASPEQVLNAGRLDRRADVYSLGATLWELLTLRPLFGATEQTPTPELMNRILVEEPESPRKYHPGLSRDLEAVVLRCLEKDARKRYATAAELAADLGRYLDGEPVRARPVRSWERGWRWAKRRPVVAALLGLVVVLAAVGLGGIVWEYGAAVREAANARQAEADALNQKNAALQAKADAEESEKRAYRGWYVSDLPLAQRAWDDAQVGRMLQLLNEQRPERTGGIDLRGFEWRYLWRLCHSDLLTLPGHRGPVTGVAFSPDGTRLASGSWDATVKVWDVSMSTEGRQAGGQGALTIEGHTGKVWSLAFSPDGQRLAAGASAGSVKVWDAQTGKEVLPLQGHTGPVTSVAFSPDGTRIASASQDKTVRVWEADTGKELRRLDHPLAVGDVAFSPKKDDQRLASACGDGLVRVWDLKTGEKPHTLGGHTGSVFAVAFSPDGERLASGGEDHTVRVWNAKTGEKLRTLEGHGHWVTGVAFSPGGENPRAIGKTLASAGRDQVVKVWDASAGKELLSLKGHGEWVRRVAFSPDGKRLASASGDWFMKSHGEVKVWDVSSSTEGRQAGSTEGQQAGSQEALTLEGHGSQGRRVAFSPEGKHLASAGPVWDELNPKLFRHQVKVWDLESTPGRLRFGTEPLTLEAHTDWVTGVAFSPDGNRLATGSWDQTVKVWDWRVGQKPLLTLEHNGRVLSVAFSPDGKHLASGSGVGNQAVGGREQAGEVKVWDLDRTEATPGRFGKVERILKAPTSEDPDQASGINGLAFSPDGKRLAAASSDKTVRVWDWRTGQTPLLTLEHDDKVLGVAYSPDGQRLASVGWDRLVRVWDAATGRPLGAFEGHAIAVTSVTFSPDGKRLATGSLDRTVKVWDAETGRETLTLRGHTDSVQAVAFSPDGYLLASAAGEAGPSGRLGEVKVWDARPVPPRPGQEPPGAGN
jgi:WD40 repeat protein/serine/threonine protein kinase